MMQWEEALEKARKIDNLYQDLDQKRIGRIWSLPEFLAACSTDWGELVENVLKQEGLRPGEVKDGALEHELGDLLWALIIISDRLEIDLLESFDKTMSELEERFKSSK
jgi:uncharacterized protein YabN with tetrapyrrole methylase and pyrophosphatase domain